MRIKYIIFALFIIFSPFSTSHSFEGPLQVKNQFPIFLHANQPYLEKAKVENSLSFSISHSSTYIVQRSEHWVINLDMEIIELAVRYKKTIKNLFEFDVDVPLLIFSGGFMDGFLNTYHRTFGFDDYGRPNRPLNSFLYEVRRNGTKVIKGEEGIGLGDIRLGIKRFLLSSDGLNISIKGGLELPVGDADKGFGNGAMDGSFSFLFDKGISERIMTYWNIGAVFTGDLIASEEVSLKNFFYAGLAVEAVLRKDLSFVIQFEGHPSVYPDTDLKAIDTCACIFAFGGRYYTARGDFEFSLTEDISNGAAPDFILNITYKMEI
jgi:hypothetical protein